MGLAVAREMATKLDPLEEREFSDGEHKSRPLESVRGEDVYVIAALNSGGGRSPGDRLVRLLFFLSTCISNGAGRVTAIAPYLPYMRKEVQTKPRDPINSQYLARLFESTGLDMLVTIEAHNKAAFQNAFRCGTLHLETHELLAAAVSKSCGDHDIVILAPDSGASKRADLLRHALSQIGTGTPGMAFMEKHRSQDLVTGSLFAGDVRHCDVVVFDDIISTGTTMRRAAEAAIERGARRVIAVATHGLFNEAAAELFHSPQIERVIVTDSAGVPALPTAVTDGKLQVVSCAPLIADVIMRLHGGGSVERLMHSR
jgi:ribose-phosphate pyrophosphokinase